MLARGWIKKGELVADPFGGIGTGGIVCAANGLRWIGCELEPRFVDLANRNFQLNPWTRNGEARIIQGDSRNFASLIGQCQACVTSPPFAGIVATQDPNFLTPGEQSKVNPSKSNLADYGSSPGQLASLPVGDVDSIISSPPYVSGGHHPDQTGAWNTNGGGQGQDRSTAGYGVTAGQLGAMKEGEIAAVVTSPPYAKSMDTIEDADARADRTNGFECGQKNLRYGQNPNTFLSKNPSGLNNEERRAIADENPQLGQLRTDTYWSSVFRIYQECFKVLKPGGIICVVIKSFVRAGKIVPLPEQTWALLQHVGFEPVERVRAMLVKEDSHPGLFDGPVVKKTERKSFFRRLAERKGSPPIDFEEVLFLKKP
jgi:DNA modification methylase